MYSWICPMGIGANIESAVSLRIKDPSPDWAWVNRGSICERLSINKNALKAYIDERNAPSADLIARLCNLLQVREAFILNGQYPIAREDAGKLPVIPPDLSTIELLDLQEQILINIRNNQNARV